MGSVDSKQVGDDESASEADDSSFDGENQLLEDKVKLEQQKVFELQNEIAKLKKEANEREELTETLLKRKEREMKSWVEEADDLRKRWISERQAIKNLERELRKLQEENYTEKKHLLNEINQLKKDIKELERDVIFWRQKNREDQARLEEEGVKLKKMKRDIIELEEKRDRRRKL